MVYKWDRAPDWPHIVRTSLGWTWWSNVRQAITCARSECGQLSGTAEPGGGVATAGPRRVAPAHREFSVSAGAWFGPKGKERGEWKWHLYWKDIIYKYTYIYRDTQYSRDTYCGETESIHPIVLTPHPLVSKKGSSPSLADNLYQFVGFTCRFLLCRCWNLVLQKDPITLRNGLKHADLAWADQTKLSASL